MKKLYTTSFNKDRLIVVEVEIEKETPQFYFLKDPSAFGYAFGYSSRVDKLKHAGTPRMAVERYIAKRSRDRVNAAAVVDQATEQLAQAYNLLRTLDDSNASSGEPVRPSPADGETPA